MDTCQILPSNLILKLLHRLCKRLWGTDIIPSSKRMACIYTNPHSGFVFHQIDHCLEIRKCRSDNIGSCICLPSVIVFTEIWCADHILYNGDNLRDFLVSLIDGFCDRSKAFFLGTCPNCRSGTTGQTWCVDKGVDLLPVVQLGAELVTPFKIVNEALVRRLPFSRIWVSENQLLFIMLQRPD